MTKAEKNNQMNRAASRIKRLTSLIEYHTDNYGALCDIPTAIGFAMHNIQILTRMNALASTPTDDLVCVGGYNAGGIRIK